VSNEIIALAGTAAALGFAHTLLGPDHYLPFIVLSKARRWSSAKTVLITLLCGIGHIFGSVILGFIGIVVGIAVFRLEAVESFRGELAAWLLIAFGFTYLVWGVHRAIRSRPHHHLHPHANETAHVHSHGHVAEHSHVHTSKSISLTPWVIFIIFVFGPCEPLIPVLMYPAMNSNVLGVALVASVFGLVTIVTMLCMVLASCYGLSKLPLREVGRYSHGLAGLSILLCGGAIKFLGL
jgi:sulfite exporter TauE/SafE